MSKPGVLFLGGDKIDAFSDRSESADAINPVVVQGMAEIGVGADR